MRSETSAQSKETSDNEMLPWGQSTSVEVKSGVGENVKTKELGDDVQMHSSAACCPVKMTVPNLGELKERLIDILEYAKNKDGDSHDIHTPFDLCDDVVSKIPSLHGSILVVANLEFIYTLIWRKIDPTKIFFATPSKTKAKVAESILRGAGNVNSIKNIFLYNNIITKEGVGDMKFDVIVGNPPYDKKDGEPIYYQFLRTTEDLMKKSSTAALIIPAGWLTGPRAEAMRAFMWDTFDIQSMVYRDRTAFKTGSTKSAAQPTVTCTFTLGKTETFTFTRIFNEQSFVTNLNVYDFPSSKGVPLVFGDVGLRLAKAAHRYTKKFALSKNCNGCCVFVSDANNSASIDPSNMTLAAYLNKIQTPFFASTTGSPKADRNHHCVSTYEEAKNLQSWLTSPFANLIFAQWATTHRNTKSNLGQVPAIIVAGAYSDCKALGALGLTEEEIKLIEDMIK